MYLLQELVEIAVDDTDGIAKRLPLFITHAGEQTVDELRLQCAAAGDDGKRLVGTYQTGLAAVAGDALAAQIALLDQPVDVD